jgi:SAM-dependent methyltransferase
MSEPWFKKAFESHYVDVYAHRDLEEARNHLPQISHLAQLKSNNGPILDLGCGQGRYTQLLSEAGHTITGLDYSEHLLHLAKERSPNTPLLRGNMLNLPFDRCFSRILSLFTSFGYFDQDTDNEKVLQEMSSALSPSGLLYLDFLNPNNVTPSPWSEQSIGDLVMKSQKNIDSALNMVIKDIELFKNKQLVSSYQERVKLYSDQWFLDTAKKFNLKHKETFGDYLGGEATDHSPRRIYLFEK